MSISYLLIKRLNLVEITTLRTEVDWNFWVPHTYIKKLMTNVNAFSIVLNLYHSSLHFTLITTDAWGIALVSVRPSICPVGHLRKVTRQRQHWRGQHTSRPCCARTDHLFGPLWFCSVHVAECDMTSVPCYIYKAKCRHSIYGHDTIAILWV